MEPEGRSIMSIPDQMSQIIHTQSETEQHISDNSYEGNIHPLCGRNLYFTNPQIYIFAPTFFISLILMYVLNKHIFNFGWHYYIGKILCIYIIYRFLSLAFSDPGMARLRQEQLPCDIGSQWRFCHICRVNMRKFTRHCDICEVCVEGYDHHCIFVGKCIGRDFLFMTFSTLIYALILSISIASQVRKVGGHRQ